MSEEPREAHYLAASVRAHWARSAQLNTSSDPVLAQTFSRYQALVLHASWMDVRIEELETQAQELCYTMEGLMEAYTQLVQSHEQLQAECDQWRQQSEENSSRLRINRNRWRQPQDEV